VEQTKKFEKGVQKIQIFVEKKVPSTKINVFRRSLLPSFRRRRSFGPKVAKRKRRTFKPPKTEPII
jgi:hypothetical protein